MNRRELALLTTIVVVVVLPLLIGCEIPDDSKNEAGQGQPKLQTKRGPQGGKWFKLTGDHRLYAELVKDYPADRVIVYILNASLTPQPNEAPNVTLVITGPFAGSSAFLLRRPNGAKSARFELVDAKMEPQLESKDVEIELHITIDGKKYVGGRQYGVD